MAASLRRLALMIASPKRRALNTQTEAFFGGGFKLALFALNQQAFLVGSFATKAVNDSEKNDLQI